jgi:hypothetical protein
LQYRIHDDSAQQPAEFGEESLGQPDVDFQVVEDVVHEEEEHVVDFAGLMEISLGEVERQHLLFVVGEEFTQADPVVEGVDYPFQ